MIQISLIRHGNHIRKYADKNIYYTFDFSLALNLIFTLTHGLILSLTLSIAFCLIFDHTFSLTFSLTIILNFNLILSLRAGSFQLVYLYVIIIVKYVCMCTLLEPWHKSAWTYFQVFAKKTLWWSTNGKILNKVIYILKKSDL